MIKTNFETIELEQDSDIKEFYLTEQIVNNVSRQQEPFRHFQVRWKTSNGKNIYLKA